MSIEQMVWESFSWSDLLLGVLLPSFVIFLLVVALMAQAEKP
ncbi:hypothetical protein [Pseudomonas nitroreducens]|nr:hypothetical protein [Pseudomonas nitroreducens]